MQPVTVKFGDKRPLVQQIHNQLLNRIRSGELEPGYKLPSMRELSRQLGVSLGIVKQAINTLTAEGHLHSTPRQGVFVAQPKPQLRDIALVLPSLENEQMLRVIRGVRNGLAGTPFRLVIQAANTDFDDEVHLLEYLDPKLVAGVILYPPRLNRYSEALRPLSRRRIPCVQITASLDGLDLDAVVVDGLELGRMCLQHLIERDHRRIGIIDVTADTQTYNEMRRGAHAALQRVGLRFEDLPREILNAGDLDPEMPWANGERAATHLLRDHPDLTALVGIDPHLTLGAYRAVKAAGRKVPEDVSVIGMGSDLPIFSHVEPPVTMIDFPMEMIAERAVHQLRQTIEAGRTGVQSIQLPPRLLERGSVANRHRD